MSNDIFNPGASAAKNNENQQAAAVNNAQQAWKTAGTNFNAYSAANPSPATTTQITAPTAQAAPQQQVAQAVKPTVVGQTPGQAVMPAAQHAQATNAALAKPQINSQVLAQILGGV